MVETERNSAISRIADLEKELEFTKESNRQLKELKKEYKELEATGKAHDEELARLLDPVTKELSGK